MTHLALLGDSIFDNKSYVHPGHDVTAHLHRLMPPSWTATLCAVDGTTAAEVIPQLERIPAEATHLVLSAGGNNAILNADVLSKELTSSAEAFSLLGDRAAAFERQYQDMLHRVLTLKKPTAVCTIYYPNFADPFMQKIVMTALTPFNDAICRYAFTRGVPLIDLRLVCNEKADYANEIEPSDAGGRKIAAAIVRLFKEHDFERHRTQVFT